jgi:YbgC/YbaW family acyl-CoA thioester hydrolase
MYVFPVTVEYEDIDSYQIAHHPKVLYYFERARVHYFFDHNVDLKKLSYGIVIRNLNIQFKIQLQMLDRITVELRTKNIDRFRFEFDYLIKKEGKVTTSATIEMVAIDLGSKKIIPIPDEMKILLENIKMD